MNLFFIPQPQRCICLTGSADIGRETPVVLCMPQPDERLVLAAGKLFEHVRTEQGPFAPVSYTHLDVYKRQVYRRCRRQPHLERIFHSCRDETGHRL